MPFTRGAAHSGSPGWDDEESAHMTDVYGVIVVGGGAAGAGPA